MFIFFLIYCEKGTCIFFFFFFSFIVQMTGYRVGNVDVGFQEPLERRPQEGVRDVLCAPILTA